MLSYRHIFHAGNFADVHKHAALIAMLRTLKSRPDMGTVHFVESHAGRGYYDLQDVPPDRAHESAQGIGKLFERKDLSGALKDYVALVRGANPDGVLRRYPGSPVLAAKLLGPGDRATFFELNKNDHPLLRRSLSGRRGVLAHRSDGYDGLAGLAGEPGLIALIDPSWETADELERARSTLHDVFRIAPQAAVLVWYPVLAEGAPGAKRVSGLEAGLRSLARPVVFFEARPNGGKATGMIGSGLALFNGPPALQKNLTRLSADVSAVL